MNFELPMSRAGLQGGKAADKWIEKSFMVAGNEIKSNDYDFFINRYKEIEYDEEKYDSSGNILNRVAELEKGIVKGVEEFRGMVG